MSTFLSIPLTTNWQKRYQGLRLAMYILISLLTIFFALRVLFPTITQSFNFRSPNSSKNAILTPRSKDSTPRTNGKIEKDGSLLADTTVVGDFSLVNVTAILEKNSATPETLQFSLSRSYQSFFFPTSEAVSDFPEEIVYKINETYYALRSGTLFPFVSEQAYLSRYTATHALPGDDTLLRTYPLSEEWLGFRVGSLLSNAAGVFIVVSESEVRPVGSADIFLALGYHFEDVTPVSEEELGVYKRGRIFLLGAVHPDGTLLMDQDDRSYYLVGQGMKHPLLPGMYRDFLLTKEHPIIVSSEASKRSVDCTLVPNLFGSALSCETPITTLTPGFGNDFELRVASPEANIDISTLSLSFETAKNKQNMMTLLSQIKQRFLSRFGLAQ